MPSNTSIYLDKCMSWLFDWHWRPNFGLIYVHCISILAKETVTKNNGKKKGWMLSIWMLITNINTTPENIQNKRYARSLGKKSMEEKIQKRKTPRKPKKKENNPLTKGLPGKFSPNHWFLFGFLKGFVGWPGYVDRNPVCQKHPEITNCARHLESSPQHRNYTLVYIVPLLRKITLVNHTCKLVVKIVTITQSDKDLYRVNTQSSTSWAIFS